MFGIIGESFKITNKYIILATPLILFSLISSVYIFFSAGGSNLSLFFAIILFFLMVCAFLSGWLFMIKKCVTNTDNDDINALLAEFPAGVGEYFLSVCGAVPIIIVLTVIFAFLARYAGMKIIGDLGISMSQLSQAISSVETMKTFLSTLSDNQLIQLNKWNILLFCTVSLNYFISMFFAPAIFFKTKNPILAFFVSVKDILGRKVLKNFGLFITISVLYLFVTIVTALLGTNIIIHFITTLINFYFTVFVAVCVFNFYYRNYVQKGSNIDKTV